MGSESGLVDTKVIEKLRLVGYTEKEFNYQYSIPNEGNKDLRPVNGKKFLSKNLKETSMNPEFLIFSKGSKPKKQKRLILIEDKREKSQLGSFDTMADKKNLYKLALTDVYHYSLELLTKTEEVKEILAIAVAGENLDSHAIYVYKSSEVNDKYANNVESLGEGINVIKIPNFSEWDKLGYDTISDFVNSQILRLNSPDSPENITHIKSVAAKLSKKIDVALKLDPYKRLLLVCGLLIGINENEDIIKIFKSSTGATLLYETIEQALPASKFGPDKKDQLLTSFRFIKDAPELQKEVANGKKSEMPLKIVTDELLTKSTVGYSVIDLMRESSHIDLLGHLFDVFTKYMQIGGSTGDIVLTPSHLTKFMSQIINVNEDDYVLDITVGSGGFLISAMHEMENKVRNRTDLSQKEKEEKIMHIKEEQLWGVEYDANMFATCVANMMLHGDGKSHIFRGDSLKKVELTKEKESRTLEKIFDRILFSKLLFNPPYTNQTEYIRNGLSFIKKGGKAAIIVPKQTFTVSNSTIVDEIFEKNRLLQVIDLPAGQFKTKNKTVGTDVAIFVFETGIPQKFNEDIVTFIKLDKDEVGTKGNQKGIPSKRTEEIYEVLTKYIQEGCLIDDYIQKSSVGKYFDKILKVRLEKGKYMYKDYAQKPVTTPTEDDFIETIGNYLEFLLNVDKGAITYDFDEGV